MMATFFDAATPHGQDDLPHYLVIKFDPTDLPAGTVDFQDLSALVRGLEEIITGMLITDLADLGGAGGTGEDRAGAFRVIAFAPAQGSYEIIITLAPILDFMVKTLGGVVPVPLDPWQLLDQFATAAGGIIGAPISDDLYTMGREQLHSLVSFLRDLRVSRWDRVSRYTVPDVRRGLSRLQEVIARPGNLARPITITPDRKKDDRVPLDQDFTKNAKRFSTRPVPGPWAQATGIITAWNSKGPYFRLHVAGFNWTIKCTYRKALDATVRDLSTRELVVAVSGIAYYRTGARQTPPPRYIRVYGVEQAPLAVAPSYVESPPSSVFAGARRNDVPGSLWSDLD